MQAPKASTWLRHETAGAGSAHWRPRSLEIPWHWLASSNKRGDARTLGRPESPPASCPAAPSASIGVACLSLPTAVSLITKTLASMYGFPTRLCTVTCQTRPPQPGPDSTNRQPVRAHVQPTGRASHACDSLPANNPLRIHPPGPPPAPPTPPPPRTRGFTPGSAARGRTTPRPAGSAAAATAACAPGPCEWVRQGSIGGQLIPFAGLKVVRRRRLAGTGVATAACVPRPCWYGWQERGGEWPIRFETCKVAYQGRTRATAACASRPCDLTRRDSRGGRLNLWWCAQGYAAVE